jgi:hypothetical protein
MSTKKGRFASDGIFHRAPAPMLAVGKFAILVVSKRSFTTASRGSRVVARWPAFDNRDKRPPCTPDIDWDTEPSPDLSCSSTRCRQGEESGDVGFAAYHHAQIMSTCM